MNRQFKGVWIPKEIYLHDQLSWTEKILLIEIQSLQDGKGCWASNQYLAEFLGVSEKTVANALSRLKGLGCIEIIQLRNPRLIRVTSQNLGTDFPKSGSDFPKSGTPPTPPYKDNNTENNTAVVQTATANNGYELFRRYYPNVPLHLFNQEQLMATEHHLDVFDEVLKIWVGRQYREQNIKGMLSLYERLLSDRKSAEVKLFCEKCEVNSGWLPSGEAWIRCKH